MYKVNSRNSMNNEPQVQDINGRANVNSLESNTLPMPSTNMDEWRRAISAPTRYRVGAASINLRPRDILQILAGMLVVAVIALLIYTNRTRASSLGGSSLMQVATKSLYNSHYPLTKPILIASGKKYRIAVITDLDHDSKVKDSKWKSHYLKGYLTVHDDMTFQVEFDADGTELQSGFSEGGRGMELSELVTFNGQLFTVDDTTGVVYKIVNNGMVPWVILSDGPGDVPNPFKSEWATVKDGYLYVGGLGKEWTNTKGVVQHLHPQFVKKISRSGSVEHLDWHKVYDAMRNRAGYPTPGYMIHEAVAWSSIHKRWYFLPRRASTEKYDDKLDESRAANILITCDESLTDIQVVKPFGEPSTTHGFSSFKFIPGTSDEYILALKSKEYEGETASYIMVFDLTGKMVLPEMKLAGNYKYEGVEFL